MPLNQSGDPGGHFPSETALRSGLVAHPLWLSARLPLAEDLLHIPKTHAEHRRQRPEAAMPLGVRLKYLAPQVVLVGSRHLRLRRRVSPPIHYTIIGIALDTVNVPAKGSVDLIMDFTDPIIRGTSLFHCHLLKHEDQGMMAKILFK